MKRYAILLLILLGASLAAPIPASAQELHLKEIFKDSLFYRRQGKFARFGDDEGNFLILGRPLAQEWPAKNADWEIRTVDLSAKAQVSTRRFSFDTEAGCEPYGPIIDAIGSGKNRRVIVQWCGKTEFLDPLTLETIETSSLNNTIFSPNGQYALRLSESFRSVRVNAAKFLFRMATQSRGKSVLMGDIISSSTGNSVCTLFLPAVAKDERLDFIARFSPDDRYFIVRSDHGVPDPKSILIPELQVALEVFEVNTCTSVSRLEARGHGGAFPPDKAPFVGRNWQWLATSGSLVKGLTRYDAELWDWRSGTRASVLHFEGGVRQMLDVSSDGVWLIARADDEPGPVLTLRDFVIWNLETKKVIYKSKLRSGGFWRGIPDSPYIVGDTLFSRNKKRLLHVNTGTVFVYSIKAEEKRLLSTRKRNQIDKVSNP